MGSPHCAWRSSWFVAPLCRHWFRCRRWCLVVFGGSSPLPLVPVVGGHPLSRVVLRHRQWLSLLSRVVTRCHWWLPAVVGGPPLLAVALPRWWSLCHHGWLPVVGSGPPLPWGLIVASGGAPLSRVVPRCCGGLAVVGGGSPGLVVKGPHVLAPRHS